MSEQTVRKVHKDLKLKIIIPVVVIVLAICTGVFGFIFMQHSTVIADNVYVNSIDVSGLTVEEAKNKIVENIDEEYFNKSVVINYNGNSYEMNLKDLVSVDAEKTANDAYEKSGSVFSKIFSRDKKIVIPFNIVMDANKAKEDIGNHFAELENTDDAFVFNDDFTKVTVDSSKFESVIDVDETINIVLENVKNDIYDKVDAISLDSDDDGYIEALYACLVRPAVDATVGINEDQTTYIIPEIVGVDVDKDDFLKLYEKNDGKFEIDVKPTHPKITTKDLNIEFYQDTLGTYTSTYNAGLVNRTKNVSLAARLVNGTVIMPGKTFSYNGVVGPRTYARGFVDATVYTGEGTEEGIGGGICQVSSTIYCAQLRANLKTVSRTNHSYTVVYVPLGQDATVVYGAIDYVFENNTGYPIKIEAYANGGYLTVNIKGTKVDKSLTYDVVSVQNSTVAKKEVTKETADLPIGETKVKQNGQNGAVVSAYKIYYKNGVEQKREFIGKSTYNAMNKIVLVGTGGKEGNTDVETEVDSETETDVVTGTETGIESGDEVPSTDVTIDTPADESTEIETGTDVPATGDTTESVVTNPELSDTGL